MNKAQLVEAISTKLGTTKAEALRTLETVIGTIVDGAKVDGECIIPTLGKLVVKETKARSGVAKGVAWSKEAGKAFGLRVSKEGKASL